MKKPLMIPAIMIIVVGIAVFALPFILPGQEGNAELAKRAGTVGGALIGAGAVFALIVGLKKPR